MEDNTVVSFLLVTENSDRAKRAQNCYNKKLYLCTAEVVEHAPHIQGDMGSNLAGCSFFSLSFYLFLLCFTIGASLIRSLKEVQLYLCVVNAI